MIKHKIPTHPPKATPTGPTIVLYDFGNHKAVPVTVLITDNSSMYCFMEADFKKVFGLD